MNLGLEGKVAIIIQVSYRKGQILYRDYNTKKDVMAVVLEMCEDVARRTREARKAGRTVSLSIGYSKDAFGGGFSRSRSIVEASSITSNPRSAAPKLA